MTKATTETLKDGDLFGPMSRYKLIFHETHRFTALGIVKGGGMWMVEDAEVPEYVFGVSVPRVIRIEHTKQDALAGLDLE